MLTGDGQASAMQSQEVGIDEVRARLLPQDKLSALTDIREKCGAVMFVGDGINDAPYSPVQTSARQWAAARRRGNRGRRCGVREGRPDFIPISIKIARKANIVSKENIVFALAIKILMLLGLFGIASMWLAVFAISAWLCCACSIRSACCI